VNAVFQLFSGDMYIHGVSAALNSRVQFKFFCLFLSGNGIYSQKSAEVSRSSEEFQLFARQSLGGQDYGLWTCSSQTCYL